MDTTNKQDIQGKRLIEVDFPLKQTSLDSVHEKNVRHGHISTLHIWPARRPLAASRAALIATLLPDPGNDEERKMILDKLAGRIVERVKKKKSADGRRIEEQVTVETEGGILHWGRESGADLQWFRDKIREAYGGRAPRVLDPFAGGGAIPLEAMRLGCEVTAVDINPVAWFILKCTLDYPQRLANQYRPLPDFACQSREFMESYFKAKGFKVAALEVQLSTLGLKKDQTSQPQLTGIQTNVVSVEADLAWHVRAWGWWVLQQAKTDLERFYPTVDGKPPVAYLWARTVSCKNCRATVPLLKTRWLCKKENKRVVLTMEPNADKTGVVFSILSDASSLQRGSTAQKRQYDKALADGTMSRSGVTCPCCSTIMTMETIRQEALAGQLGAIMTAVVVDSPYGKEYRLPTPEEITIVTVAEQELEGVYTKIPFNIPNEPLPNKEALGFRVPLYGFDKWYKLFTPRQLLAIGTFVKWTRSLREVMRKYKYSDEWVEAVSAYLAIGVDKLTDYVAALCTWHISGEKMSHVFVRFALPVHWDYAELNPLSDSSGNYLACIDWVSRVVEHNTHASENSVEPHIVRQSAIATLGSYKFDAIVTDPPYYDSIGYSVM